MVSFMLKDNKKHKAADATGIRCARDSLPHLLENELISLDCTDGNFISFSLTAVAWQRNKVREWPVRKAGGSSRAGKVK